MHGWWWPSTVDPCVQSIVRGSSSRDGQIEAAGEEGCWVLGFGQAGSRGKLDGVRMIPFVAVGWSPLYPNPHIEFEFEFESGVDPCHQFGECTMYVTMGELACALSAP